MIGAFRLLNRAGVVAGLAIVLLLSCGIYFGSQNLKHYDPILLTYTFGTLFAAFAVAYRYAVWLQRPPTTMYVKRGFTLIFRSGSIFRNLFGLFRSGSSNLVAQRFIVRRSFIRWFTHFCLAWGTMIAVAVTFPLVFGWIHFASRPDAPEVYRVMVFGMAMGEFSTEGLMRYIMFNLLNLAAVMVIAGSLMALHRRLKDPAPLARQQFGNDVVPIVLLLAISVTGLLLTFSMHALRGTGYAVISLIHALTVTVALLYLPFGKFFHIFQRPLHLSVIVYRRANKEASPAVCRRCGEGFAGKMHVADLQKVLAESGVKDPSYIQVCPRCRRGLLGLCQARAMGEGEEAPNG